MFCLLSLLLSAEMIHLFWWQHSSFQSDVFNRSLKRKLLNCGKTLWTAVNRPFLHYYTCAGCDREALQSAETLHSSPQVLFEPLFAQGHLAERPCSLHSRYTVSTGSTSLSPFNSKSSMLEECTSWECFSPYILPLNPSPAAVNVMIGGNDPAAPRARPTPIQISTAPAMPSCKLTGTWPLPSHCNPDLESSFGPHPHPLPPHSEGILPPDQWHSTSCLTHAERKEGLSKSRPRPVKKWKENSRNFNLIICSLFPTVKWNNNITVMNLLLCWSNIVSGEIRSGFINIWRFDHQHGQQVVEFPNNVPRLEQNPLCACHGLANDA